MALADLASAPCRPPRLQFAFDTPTIHGFGLSGTFGKDDYWDVAANYTGEWHGFRVAAAVGHRWYADREPDVLALGSPDTKLRDTDRRHWLSSASVMHVSSGFYLSAAYTRYEFRGSNPNEVIAGLVDNGNRPDIPHWWASGGIQRNWMEWGNTTILRRVWSVWIEAGSISGACSACSR